jgi:hypothetical protein
VACVGVLAEGLRAITKKEKDMFKRLLFPIVLALMLVVGTCLSYADDTTETSTTTTSSSSETTAETSTATTSSILEKMLDTFKDTLSSASSGGMYDVSGHTGLALTIGSLYEKETTFGTFSFDGGYGDSDTAVVGLSYKTGTLENWNISVPVLDKLFAKVGYAVGGTSILDDEREFVHGPMVTFGADFKF